MTYLDGVYVGLLIGVLVTTVVVGYATGKAIENPPPPLPWTVQERECSKGMIKEYRELGVDMSIQSTLEDCRYLLNKYKAAE